MRAGRVRKAGSSPSSLSYPGEVTIGRHLSAGEIGNRIRALRERDGLSREDLGRRLGVSADTVCDIERGARVVLGRELVEVSRTFGVTTAELVRREDPDAPREGGEGLRKSLQIFRTCIEEFHGIEALVR